MLTRHNVANPHASLVLLCVLRHNGLRVEMLDMLQRSIGNLLRVRKRAPDEVLDACLL